MRIKATRNCFIAFYLVVLFADSERSYKITWLRQQRRRPPPSRSYHNDVRLSPEDANSFGGKVFQLAIHKRFRRGLEHECYEEGCDFEEVTETLSYSEAREYYNRYTCQKFGRNCEEEENCDWDQCEIGGQCYSNLQVNPWNQCQLCSWPWSNGRKNIWINREDFLPCSDGELCTRDDRCFNGRCIGTPLRCLSCEYCYNDECLAKYGYCVIDGSCYTHGDPSPYSECKKCDSQYKTSWTNDDSLPCNDGDKCTRSDRCSNGRCIGTPFTCLFCEKCDKDKCRVIRGHCAIFVGAPWRRRKKCFSHRTRRPYYPCQECDSNNPRRWTINNNLRCSDYNRRTKDDRCRNGYCRGTPYNCLSCEQHDGSGCPIRPGFCIILKGNQRRCYAKNQYKPGNRCQWCDPGKSTSTWTNREGVACDDGDKCTWGDTCRRGQCIATPFTCNSVCQYCNGYNCSLKTGYGFVNDKCTCKLAGKDYGHQTLNPSNLCQWCDLYDSTARANSVWSDRPAVACDDQDACTKQDTCNAGRCLGQGYSCQSSFPSPSCIQTSVCVGDGTCRFTMKSNGTVCRAATDNCDTPERCNGVLMTCPEAVTDSIELKAGQVQFMDSRFHSIVTHQYFTDRVYLELSGFSLSCGKIHFTWFLLSGLSSCSLNSSFSGSLPDTSRYHTITGLTMEDYKNYKFAVKASDMRLQVYKVVCSDLIVIDTSKPQDGWIRDGSASDLSYQASKLLQVNWGGVLTRHGVGNYDWKVLLTPFNTNQTMELIPFTNVYRNTSAQKTFSNIRDGSKVKFVVRAYTKAGLFSDLTSNGVVIDTSAPVAGKIFDGDQVGLDLKFSQWSNTFNTNWDRFIDPHSPISRYTWALQRLGTGLITSFQATALNRAPTATNLNLVSGERYCAVVRGYNEAGLYTQVNSDCVLIDHDVPLAGTVNDGHFHDVDYQSEDTMIAANWHGFTDGSKGSGIVEYRCKVTEDGGAIIVPWTSAGNATNIMLNGLVLKNNTKYFVTVKAVDAVGLSTDITTDGVTLDTTHPVFTGKVIVTGEDDVINGTPCVYISSVSSVTVQWNGFSDAHSGLQRYEWAIIPSDKSISDSDFKEVSGSSLPTFATFYNLALIQGKGYYVIIRAYNGAKLYKDAFSVVVIPDYTPPSPGEVFDGPTFKVDIDYQAETQHVYGSWSSFSEPHSAVKQYYYAVGSCIFGNNHITGNGFTQTDPPRASSFLISNVSLVNGQRYCIKIKAENKAGLMSYEVSSNGFVVDVTPPNTRKAQVRDGITGADIDYQANTTAMSAKWDGFADLESQIQYYEYGVSRNRAGTPNVYPLTTNGLNTSATAGGLSLTDDVYYFIVCAVNNAGLRSCISSDGALIDLTPPSHGVVHDGIIEPDLQYQSSLSSMAANWEGIWDLESGIEKFEWSIGTSANDKSGVQDYVDVGLSTHVRSPSALNLSSGTKYFVHLKVINQAGAVRELISDGVIADGTPPIPSKIYPGFGPQDEWMYSEEENAFYSASGSSIAVYWNQFSEPESEVWYYKWAIGTSKCGTQVQPLINIGRSNYANTTTTNLFFRPGVRYYASVMSRNKAGLVSRACSDALVFDNSPPLPGIIHIKQPPGSNITKTFIANNSAAIYWEGFSDPESEIQLCNISIIDQAGDIKFVETTNSSSGFIMIPDNVLFVDGQYNISAYCINNANLACLSRSVFIVDNTPPVQSGPVVTGISFDGALHYQSDDKSSKASWPPFTDPESGIERYYVAIGSQPYQGDIIGFENVYLATRINKTDVTLSQGAIYYITVVAVNRAGLSTNVSSLGLMIDNTPPLAYNADIIDGMHGEDIDYISPDTVLSAHWEKIADLESGIMQSQYCVGTKPLGCQIKPMTSVGRNLSFTCPDCIIQEGMRLYVTVQVTNGAGLSETRHSDGMLLDVSPPLMGDVHDGSHVTGMDYNVVLEQWNISMTWFGVEDDESGIRSCKWTIESNSGSIFHTDDIGNNTIYEERNLFSLNQTYKTLLVIPNATFFNVLTCINRAGLHSTVRSNGFQVRTIWPIPAVVRVGATQGKDAAYVTSYKIISTNWDPFFDDESDPVVDYELAVGTVTDKESVLGFTSVGLGRIVEIDLAPGIPDLEVLETGVTYYTTIKATSLRGLSSMKRSTGFTLDPSPPMQTELLVSHKVIDQIARTVEIRVSWNSVRDSESGISNSAYCLGTTPGRCQRASIPAGLSTFGTIGPFRPYPWVHYFVIVVVTNGAGLITVMSSRKLLFDTTPPSKGIVIDGIGPDIDFMNYTSSLSIQWKGIDDQESGIANCSWTLIEQSASDNRTAFENDTVVLTQPVESKGSLTRENLSLMPGARYVSKIACSNNDGFISMSFSDGVVVDVTSPSAVLVRDGSSLSTDVEYQPSTTVVEAIWSPFEDHESGISEYRWGLGTMPDDVSIVKFTSTGKDTTGRARNVTLSHGVRYYVTVEATNGAGMTSHGWSSGFTVDVTPPEITEISAGSELWIGPTDHLHATWKVQDLESDIIKTEYCVGTLPAGCQIKSMTAILPNSTKVPCEDCRLNHYGTYFISIRVTNGAGLSTVTATNETKVDMTPPVLYDVVPQFSFISCISNCNLVANITGVRDEESGIRSCSYAIRNSSFMITDFVDIGLNTTVEATDLELMNGQQYYTVVKCENSVGLTAERVSSPVVVDNTPPSKGSVIVSEDRTHDVFGVHSSCHLFNKTLRVHWYGFNDNESEISDFRVAVGRQPKATDVLQFHKVGLVTDVYLPLTNSTFDGDIVYVTVESRNSAGLATQSSSPATRLVAADSEEYIKQGDFYCLNV